MEKNFSGVKKMKIKYVVGVLVAVVVGSCQTTPRTIDLITQDLVLDTPVQVQPPGAKVAAFSPDGQFYAVQIMKGATSCLEVRHYDGRTVNQVPIDSKTGPFPLMFLSNGRELICSRTCLIEKEEVEIGFVVLDWRSGRSVPIGVPKRGQSGSSISAIFALGLLTNQAETLLFIGDGVVLSSGKVIGLSDRMEYLGRGENNSLLFKEKNAWVMVLPDGSMKRLQNEPSTVAREIVERGQMALTPDISKVEHLGTEADVETLWLTHQAANTERGVANAAVVGVGYDLGKYGFVPNRDAIYFQASDAFYVVPFHLEEKK